jgi:hypothetical protein
LTQKEPTKLLDWMTFLGLRTRVLAKRLGLSPGAIDAAGMKGCRRSRWLPALSQLIHVPVDILLDTTPEDPAAGQYRLPALLRAADIRMRYYRFEPPSPPPRGIIPSATLARSKEKPQSPLQSRLIWQRKSI